MVFAVWSQLLAIRFRVGPRIHRIDNRLGLKYLHANASIVKLRRLYVRL